MDLRHNYRAFKKSFDKDAYLNKRPYVITRMSLSAKEVQLDFNFPIDCILKDLIQIHFYGSTITYWVYPYRVIMAI